MGKNVNMFRHHFVAFGKKVASPFEKTSRTNVEKIVDAYFSGELSGPVEEKIQAWLLHDKERQAEKDAALENAWNRVVQYNETPRPFALDSFEEIRARVGFPATAAKKKKWRLSRVAAVLLPLFAMGGVAWMLLSRGEQPPRTVIEAPANTTNKVTLSDGTDVVLNTNTSLSYREERAVTLEGEAFFKVVKGKKPFVVTAGNVTVTVLGTTFNMEAYPDRQQVRVTLFEGTVRLDNERWSYTMTAGEEMLFDPVSGERRLTRVDTTLQQPAWYAATPAGLTIQKFSEILDTIARRYDVSIENRRPELNDNTYTLPLDEAGSLEDALHVLQLLGSKFTCKVENGVVTIE
jgi:ferric-dicitrate binding protein FerR (iron transport regulator)